MTKEFKEGQGYTKEDWDAVDSPELTDEELAQARPFAEVFPDLAESIRRSRGRPKVDSPRQQISLRLDPDVIEKFKATGKGWQSRINDVLKAAKL
ncbi:MAG TPA: BrnA antitoxin family protein [Devosia sp.]|nr:BrnA antitoxin family protein [Devosia sp.]